MNKAKWFSVIGALTVSALAAPASAATWQFTRTLSGVEITDDTNNGGTDKKLVLVLSSAGTFCGSAQTLVNIKETDSTLFDEWVRLAQSAFLSGRTLTVYSSNVSGTCKAYSVKVDL